MVRKLDPEDFRASRKILEPSDFALGGDEPDHPPTDLISEEVWDEIIVLPTDVAIRTTSHQGERIELLNTLWSGWVEVLPDEGMLAEAMLDVADDFQAALFNLMHGFYKQAITALRNSLEIMVFTCKCELSKDSAFWNAWRDGERSFRFQHICENLASQPKLSCLEAEGEKVTGTRIFPPDGQYDREYAWATCLYKRLCEFAHPRGTNAQLWESNGPIYSAEGMQLSYYSYLETYALLILIAKIARDEFEMPAEARILYMPESITEYLTPSLQDGCSFYKEQLFPG